MNDSENPPLPKLNTVVQTACRGQIIYEPHTPTAVYRGRRLYFCLPDCLAAFKSDPATSCLASDPLLQEP